MVHIMLFLQRADVTILEHSSGIMRVVSIISNFRVDAAVDRFAWHTLSIAVD